MPEKQGVNTGTDSTCKACDANGRECLYPNPGTSSTPKRLEPTPGTKTEEGESKKRSRKGEDFGRRNSHRPREDVLDPSVLTEHVWNEIYAIFKKHFSTEMLFLHSAAFRTRFRQFIASKDAPAAAGEDQENGKLLLLAVLTLTARFHPGLVATYSPNAPEKPIIASEYYAEALINSEGLSGINLTIPSLERIQALLMLGLYEWGQSKGARAWVHVGAAIRLAQLMELPYEDAKGRLSAKYPSVQEDEKEVRRRTMWSCFVMDRMLSAGKFRMRMVDSNLMRVRLPSHDTRFFYGSKAEPGFLHDPVTNTDDAILNRYVRIVDIFGDVSKWSLEGGRRTEEYPPWDQRSRFYQFRRQLERFRADLPPTLEFSRFGLNAHIEMGSISAYTSMYLFYLVCLIMLHREFVPFVPLNCETGPVGPLDEPTFPKDKYDIPEGFWEDSAKILFRSAKEIVEVATFCHSEGYLPESAQICFCLWIAAFTGLYAVLFPWMDIEESMHRGQGAANGSKGHAESVVKIMNQMLSRTTMARTYVTKTGKWMKEYDEKKHQYKHQFPPLQGGGLDDYKGLEKELNEFGALEDDNRVSEEPLDGSRASTHDINTVSSNGESMQGVEGTALPPIKGWAPINSSRTVTDPDERSKLQTQNNFQYGYQSSGQGSHEGDALARLNSPYRRADGLPPFSRPNVPDQYHLPPIASTLSMAQSGAHSDLHRGPYGSLASDGHLEDNRWESGLDDYGWQSPGFDDIAQQYTEELLFEAAPQDKALANAGEAW
ncbi:hypothetical protein BP5796_05295 [Coleophoma crateriformis]|uniref:Xylanolytic transcriptional activator regulatory domain-containing protein n=1 Tax=Coleophoma crateriformis TaxID=565419 RepID=A0A3D8S2R3_9HELO|nr:hypothetical protein BP5796_05295 [Coleophoma crateriformis]